MNFGKCIIMNTVHVLFPPLMHPPGAREKMKTDSSCHENLSDYYKISGVFTGLFYTKLTVAGYCWYKFKKKVQTGRLV